LSGVPRHKGRQVEVCQKAGHIQKKRNEEQEGAQAVMDLLYRGAQITVTERKHFWDADIWMIRERDLLWGFVTQAKHVGVDAEAMLARCHKIVDEKIAFERGRY
jgi:hypothetical protein